MLLLLPHPILRSIFTCTKAGNITIRSFNPHELQEYHDDDITDDNNNNSILANRNKYSIDISNFNVQAPVEVMKVFLPSGGSPEYAIGGKENNLKIYDVETQKIIYKPRNVGHNFLDMQMPIWITDLVYLDPFGQKLATCTGYHQIRLYDRRAFLNKPVMSKWTGEHPFKCMATTGVEHAVVVGDTIGTMFHFDFRQFGIIRKYRGIGGAVRAIQAHPLANYHQYKSNTCFIASCGADRYLRVYNMRTRARTHKLYLKQMLNCLLFTSEPLNANTGAVIEVEHSAKQKDDKEYDDMWEKLDQAIDENESEQKKAPKSAKPAQAQAAAAAAPTAVLVLVQLLLFHPTTTTTLRQASTFNHQIHNNTTSRTFTIITTTKTQYRSHCWQICASSLKGSSNTYTKTQ
eukprot:GEZU01011456.1.p1 GENE.GEZU01011456.1~~GEZU01011456.1.p1  ORF type:complete len:403 (+),score=84.01 GEZU01011456.1:362-1570(+)